MPELPEVETVCRGLRETILNKSVLSITANRSDMRLPIDSLGLRQFHHKKIISIERRSKYIILYFDKSHSVIIIHLGMSGRLSYYDIKRTELVKHTHIEFNFDDGSHLCFIDPRRFGFIQVINHNNLIRFWCDKKLGIEPLEDQFDGEYLFNKLANKKVTLKSALLDQRVVSGLGNIYVCEALFLSKLSPLKISHTMSLTHCKKLVKYVKIVLTNAISAGGSTLRDHQSVKGDAGYFQYSFSVYGQENKKCTVCKTGIIKRIKQNGRSTFFCNICQKSN